jgi:hypothetical protein
MVKILHYKPDVPTGKKVETINPKKIPLPSSFNITKIHYSNLAPETWAGNHKHSRVEVFISYDKLLFIWLDKKGKRHKETMGKGKDGTVKIFVLKPKTPHLIINNKKQNLTYIELCDGKLDDVVKLEMLG